DPIRVGSLQVVIGRMRIGADDDHHSQLAAAGNQLSENIPVPQPSAAMMKWNLRGVIRDTSAATQASRIGTGAFEIVEPKSQIELPRIILDQSKLGPAHGFIDPRRCGSGHTSGLT